MNTKTTQPLLLFLGNQTQTGEYISKLLEHPKIQDNFIHLFTDIPKKAVKHIKKTPDLNTVILALDHENQAAIEGICNLIRDIIHNEKIKIVLLVNKDSEIDTYDWLDNKSVDLVITNDLNQIEMNVCHIHSQVNSHINLVEIEHKHENEMELLSTLARFARLDLKLSECLSEFAKSALFISEAILSNVIVVRPDNTLRRTGIVHSRDNIEPDKILEFLKNDPKPSSDYLISSMHENRLQLNVDENHPVLLSASEVLGNTVNASFAFPLRRLDKTMCIIECFMPKSSLNNVSVNTVRLIEKSSEQLSVLFERNESESRLQKQFKQLKRTINELSNTKEALYQSEKLASIGQLAAGIAHEINNPISFVLSNFGPLDEYIGCMTKMLDLHNEFVKAVDTSDITSHKNIRSNIEQEHENLDIEYVLDDVKELVTESRGGLIRVKEIISDLNQFARKDEIDISQTDLIEAIHSTLKILQNQTKYGVEIHLDLNQIPHVMCNSGLIKQVLLNLIQNACQAMNNKGELHITTNSDDKNVFISVRDTGPGIPEDSINKIFEPFYTTKDVGVGTGLGLSVSHGIIERHKGTLEVVTTSAEGTEFRITLPVTSSSDTDTDTDTPILKTAS